MGVLRKKIPLSNPEWKDEQQSWCTSLEIQPFRRKEQDSQQREPVKDHSSGIESRQSCYTFLGHESEWEVFGTANTFFLIHNSST